MPRHLHLVAENEIFRVVLRLKDLLAHNFGVIDVRHLVDGVGAEHPQR